jgi:hypothetical protein
MNCDLYDTGQVMRQKIKVKVVRTKDFCGIIGTAVAVAPRDQLDSNEDIISRVYYESNFDSKQPKLEPKLVSTLSATRRLFRLFRLNTETRSFGVSIEPKQNENNRKNPKKLLKLKFINKF